MAQQATSTAQTAGGEVITLAGRVQDVVYRSPQSDFHVLLVRREDSGAVLRACGPIVEPESGAQVQLTGRFIQGPRGEEFSFRAGRVLELSGVALTRYIARRCGIGVEEALALTRALGDNALTKLDQDASCARHVSGLSPESVERVLAAYRKEGPAETALLLRSAGARESTVRELVSLYGSGLHAALEQDSYLPCLEAGESLSVGDALAEHLKLARNENARTRAAIMLALTKFARAGQVAVDTLEAGEAAGRLLGKRPGTPAVTQALAELTEASRVRFFAGRVGLEAHARLEASLAERLSRLRGALPEAAGLSAERLLELGQRSGRALGRAEATTLSGALGERLVVLQASFARDAAFFGFLVKALALLNVSVELLAPSQRHVALASRAGLPARHVRDFTVPTADVTLVLETDRLSLPEIDALIDNWPATHALWFCGDARRVGGATPGQVFRDLWEHAALGLEVPASFVHPIAPALDRLFAEHPPAASARDLSGQVHVIYSPEHEIAASARVLRDEVLASLGYDADDVLFVCPVRAGGVSVDTLNAQLGSHELRAGMPVLCERDVPGIAVRRGERGVLEAYSKRHGSARFGACAYPVGNGRGQVSSAYCVSAHRAGGSLARVVVLVLASSHGALLSREVVYSAASAAIERVLILAPREALARALTTSQPEHRGGWFAELLRVAP